MKRLMSGQFKARHLLMPLILVGMVVTSCKGPTKPGMDIPKKNVPDPVATTGDSIPKNFYKRYEGNIAGKPVVMQVSVFDGRININYYYTDHGETIFTYQDRETVLKNDSIRLVELKNYMGEQREDEPDNQMHVLISAGSIKGEWIGGSTGKKYEIDLKEAYNNEAARFKVIGFKDSMQYLKFKTDTPMARTSLMLLEPADENLDASWFANVIKNEIFSSGADYKPLTLQQSLEKWGSGFLNDYRAEADSFHLGNDSGSHYFLNFEQNFDANLLYNNNGFVVMPISFYEYHGGAHGMHGTNMICFDMIAKKRLLLPDVIKIDSSALQSVMEKYFRMQFGLKPNGALTDVLFENKLPSNQNFYFTSKGLGFNYAPYEIAAYVYGEINIWVPFTELKPYLNPDFMKRMKL